MTLKQLTQYIIDLTTDSLKYMIPFVVVDPSRKIQIENYVSYPLLSINLAETKAGNFFSFLDQICSNKYSVILFKNIDKISSHKYRNDWKSIVIKGLKAEDSTFVFDTVNAIGGLKEYHIHFSKLRVICTCAKYPDFLKKQGNLGMVGATLT